MAKKLPESERRRLLSDFDPPDTPHAPKAGRASSVPLNEGKRVRVTASLTPGQYFMLKELAKQKGYSMSRVLSEAVAELYVRSR